MKVLVTGATGFIGRHLVEALPGAVVAGRNRARLQALFPGREARVWDPAADPDPALVEGVEAVVHLAGASIFNGRWNASRKKKIMESRVAGTRWLV